ncbi:recombinase family protein [Endozoicomonas sp. 4G]|uniref:recombinase family protein n=1 Tax=Endozoicomonas sp. 4G TaxID=2872754 RepID=UPI00207863E8|nr:recombinase family protein [Endozoicomonas sp. 4G]
MADIAYIRVSTVDQNTERQLTDLTADRTFIDKCSGKDTNRPQLTAMLDYAREGDTIHVHSIDRLARSLTDLRSLIDTCQSKGISVKFHKNNLEFSGNPTPTDNLLLNMLGAVAEFERDMIKERQAEGIAKAKAKGIYKGRKKQYTSDQIQAALQETNGNKAAAARLLGCSVMTINRAA